MLHSHPLTLNLRSWLFEKLTFFAKLFLKNVGRLLMCKWCKTTARTGNKEETIPILTKGKQFNGAYFLKPCNLHNCFKRCCFDFLFLRGLPQKTQQSLKNDDRDCHIVNLSIVAFSKKSIGPTIYGANVHCSAHFQHMFSVFCCDNFSTMFKFRRSWQFTH